MHTNSKRFPYLYNTFYRQPYVLIASPIDGQITFGLLSESQFILRNTRAGGSVRRIYPFGSAELYAFAIITNPRFISFPEKVSNIYVSKAEFSLHIR